MADTVKTPSFEVEEGGGERGRRCRQRPPSVLWFGESCSSTVVLTTSLTMADLFQTFLTTGTSGLVE